MTKLKRNRLIVVLGMHRSGTSAITRGLQVLGVDLGVRLIPPVDGNNAKGFWEDVHLNALDAEMLDAIGSDWDHVGAIDFRDVEVLHKQGYLLRAVELLREKVGSAPIFAFKDPRVAKLLPFWNEVFAYGQFDVNYVLALRHPLSVAKSLTKRDGLDVEQSYLLWLGHVLTSLIYSADKKRVLVDYDRLMQSPEYELNRIAKHLELEVDPVELQNYKTEFLDDGLRHTLYALNDLLHDQSCPQIVREIYPALLEIASDQIEIDAISSKVIRWSDEFERLKSILKLIDKLFVRKAVLNQAVVERDRQIVDLTQTLAERSRTLAERSRTLAERSRTLAERDEQIMQILGSRSWKITRPFRAVSRTLSKYSKKVSL